MRQLCFAALGVAAICVASGAQAGVVFDTGMSVSSPALLRSLQPGGAYAVRFSVTGPVALTRASTVGSALGAAPVTLSFGIASVDADLPGADLFGCTAQTGSARASYGCDLGQSIAAGDYFLTVRSDGEFGVQTLGNFSTPILRKGPNASTYSTEGFAAQFTLLGTPLSVPEPASWMLMIGGFGFAGGAMRQQKRRVRFAPAS